MDQAFKLSKPAYSHIFPPTSLNLLKRHHQLGNKDSKTKAYGVSSLKLPQTPFDQQLSGF